MSEYILSKVKKYFETLVKKYNIESTEDIFLSDGPFDNIIGQKQAVAVIQQAVKARRHILLIGQPGTGKSLLAKTALTQIPKYEFSLISCNNIQDTNKPYVQVILKSFNWDAYVDKHKIKPITLVQVIKFFLVVILAASIWASYNLKTIVISSPIPISITFLLSAFNPLGTINSIRHELSNYDPLAEGKKIYTTDDKKYPNFIDITGATYEHVFGDVSHDPLAGLHISSPRSDVSYKLLKPGAIHLANQGVLYVDEIGTLDRSVQYGLLTVIEDKESKIKGSKHSGTSSQIESLNKIPCNFSLIMAGNHETMSQIHSALRSRIKGYGYEITMNDSMPITESNTLSLMEYIAREIKNNGYVPFDKKSILLLLYQAVALSIVPNEYTLQLRAFNGEIRTASDYAKLENLSIVSEKVYTESKKIFPNMVQQINKRLNSTTNINLANQEYPICIHLSDIESDLVNTSEIYSAIVSLSFYESVYTGSIINIPNFKIQSNKAITLNKVYQLDTIVKNKLSKHIFIPENKTLNILLTHKELYRFVIEENNLVFGILGQYLNPLKNTVYIGEILENGFIKALATDTILIDLALEKNYKIITSIDNSFYSSSKNIKYIANIKEILYVENNKWI
jgi:lon-related putative ATP-dependent protease